MRKWLAIIKEVIKLKKKIKFTKETLGLSLVLLLSTLLNFVNLGLEGYSNAFYAAGVKSMTMNLKNFFFVSFDPASFVSIDKPPLGFWIQTISAKIFGFNSWGILIPQALAGVLSVAVIYHLVKRSYGSTAALISALCLATTPIFVAVSRNNTCDNLLVLTLLLACWALTIAAEKGKIKYLLLSLAIVGLGFNIKMLQAYMVVPAIYITYLLSTAVSMKKRIKHLLIGTLVLLLVSFSWAFIVDLVPAANRPYVDSSTNNSEMELIVGWNGLNRLGLGGNSAMGGGAMTKSANGKEMGMTGGMPGGMEIPKGMEIPSGGGAGGGMMGGGKSSTTRLFTNNSLSDQIIWLFPLAIFGFIAAVLKEKFKNPFNNDRRKSALILWSMWLLPVFLYFSFTSGMFHPYYLTMLAPPIAALCGIGIVSMWELYKKGGWKSWILPAAFIVDGLVQLLILSYFYKTSKITKYLMIAMAILCFVSSIILIIVKLTKNENMRLKKNLLITAVVGLLITPTVWSGVTMFYPVNGSMPSAGLEITSSKTEGVGMGIETNDNTKLIRFLETHNTTEKYEITVSTSMGIASDIIIKTGKSAMSLGGFLGSDKILTLKQFKSLVAKGEVRYVMVGGDMGGSSSSDAKKSATEGKVSSDVKAAGAESTQNSEIMTWASKAGTLVLESEWKDATKPSNTSSINKKSSDSSNHQQGGMGGLNSGKLYDLKNYADSITKR
ncbi:glycosyltransferase family 39 protein [Clostridium algoriphilum]|uniref:glycosyltransferase family 39 protein n=1 Tax=Clostridium algoriphilum TaxID=198347 RepID=UPI001CF2E787|nr:glycosyltransferase family 39 protein [Clostridium algoriphilum]MCB2295608.1 glycosyltransferase family 39 protein [Clostridium algoriphilum]